MTAASDLDSLRRQQPEWEPWLRVVDVALREIEDPAWARAVPGAPPGAGACPALAGAAIVVPARLVQAYLERLLRTASTSGTQAMATLESTAASNLDGIGLLRASIAGDRDELRRAGAGSGADADALQSVLALLAVPFLQACIRVWGARLDWVESYCAVCGSWPAFTEVRGIERSRYYRCGRCGGEWHAHGLSCPFCSTVDHHDLVRLVPGDPSAAAAIEACRKCLGYVKTFNRLQGCAPAAVLIEDLGSVALDVAALEQGYSRPASPGYAIEVGVTATTGRRFLAWNS